MRSDIINCQYYIKMHIAHVGKNNFIRLIDHHPLKLSSLFGVLFRWNKCLPLPFREKWYYIVAICFLSLWYKHCRCGIIWIYNFSILWVRKPSVSEINKSDFSSAKTVSVSRVVARNIFIRSGPCACTVMCLRS